MENNADGSKVQLEEMLAPRFTLECITREGCVAFRKKRLEYEKKFVVSDVRSTQTQVISTKNRRPCRAS